MKIGIDLGHIAEGATGGLVPHLQGVLDALFAGWPRHEVVIFGAPVNEGLFASLPAHVRRLTLEADNYHLLLDTCAAALCLDVLFSSYPAEAELTFPADRRVVLIPDLQHEFFPDFFDAETLRARRAAFGAALRGAAVATLSEHAKRTLLDRPDARGADVFVSGPALRAAAERPDALTSEERALVPAGDFFLYPANLWPHKNHRRVLEAFERFLRTAPRPVVFVFTGHPSGWDELRRDFPNLPIRHLGFVRRDLLQVLLARARALVFFSLFEGFGMPLLEAFAAGTPVVCSNTTSLPEVGGDAVLACDPTDVNAMSDCMTRVCTDEALRGQLVARGRERLALYDWHASAAALVGACERVCARAADARPDSLPAVRRLTDFVQEVQADRAARLEVIQKMDAHIRAAEAARVAQEAAWAAHAETHRRTADALREVEDDRRALRATVQRLDAALREWAVVRNLRAGKRWLQRRLGKASHAAPR